MRILMRVRINIYYSITLTDWLDQNQLIFIPWHYFQWTKSLFLSILPQNRSITRVITLRSRLYERQTKSLSIALLTIRRINLNPREIAFYEPRLALSTD
jgi:hypothetical protein